MPLVLLTLVKLAHEPLLLGYILDDRKARRPVRIGNSKARYKRLHQTAVLLAGADRAVAHDVAGVLVALWSQRYVVGRRRHDYVADEKSDKLLARVAIRRPRGLVA